MPDLILPKQTTANERLLGKSYDLATMFQTCDNLERQGWIIDRHPEPSTHGGLHIVTSIYQPLFGLTAKTPDGRLRTVIEGDVLKVSVSPCLILWEDFGFVGRFNREPRHVFFDLWKPRQLDDTIILAHCTDIVAQGNQLKCWECRGSKMVTDRGQKNGWCPTCKGDGQFGVTWTEPGDDH